MELRCQVPIPLSHMGLAEVERGSPPPITCSSPPTCSIGFETQSHPVAGWMFSCGWTAAEREEKAYMSVRGETQDSSCVGIVPVLQSRACRGHLVSMAAYHSPHCHCSQCLPWSSASHFSHLGVLAAGGLCRTPVTQGRGQHGGPSRRRPL